LSRPVLLPSLALPFLLACGGGAETSAFLVDPPNPIVSAGEQVVIVAQPATDLGGDLDWEVEEPYGGGLLRSHGPRVTYVAPEAAGTYHLVLRAVRPGGQALKQTVAVQVVGASSIDPPHARLAPGAGTDFTSRLRGLGSGAVRWTVVEGGGGSITEDGHYTAPSRPGTYHVKAIAVADATVTAQATVTVEAP